MLACAADEEPAATSRASLQQRKMRASAYRYDMDAAHCLWALWLGAERAGHALLQPCSRIPPCLYPPSAKGYRQIVSASYSLSCYSGVETGRPGIQAFATSQSARFGQCQQAARRASRRARDRVRVRRLFFNVFAHTLQVCCAAGRMAQVCTGLSSAASSSHTHARHCWPTPPRRFTGLLNGNKVGVIYVADDQIRASQGVRPGAHQGARKADDWTSFRTDSVYTSSHHAYIPMQIMSFLQLR